MSALSRRARRTVVTLAAASLATSVLAGCQGTPSAGSAPTGTSPAAGSAGSSSGGGSGASAGKQVNACSLVTAAQASTAVGSSVVSAKQGVGVDMCNYAGPQTEFFTIVTPGAGAAAWKEQLATLQEDGSATPLPIAGVGDRAAGCGTEIGVQADGYIIDVHGADMNGNEKTFPDSVAMAKVIIAALH